MKLARTRTCPLCGSPEARFEHPARYEYDHCGLTGVFLEGNAVELTECDKCGEGTSMIYNEVQLMDYLGLVILLSGPGLTGEEIAYLRSLYRMSQEDLATAIGRSRRETIADWEARGTQPVFRAPFDELNLRVVLMSLFQKKVVESKWCCLAPRHLDQFHAARRDFISRVDEMLTPREPHGPRSLRRIKSSGEWAAVRGRAA